MTQSMSKFKNGKSSGMNGILAEMLKTSKIKIVEFLSVSFDNLFQMGLFPDSWSISILVPTHKKGDFNNPDN